MAQLCAHVDRSLADADYPKAGLIGTPNDLATTSGFGDLRVCPESVSDLGKRPSAPKIKYDGAEVCGRRHAPELEIVEHR